MKHKGLVILALLLGTLIQPVNPQISLDKVGFPPRDQVKPELDLTKGELELLKWGEASLKISLPETPESNSLISEKYEFEYTDYKAQFYETSEGFEIDIILNEVPSVSIWTFNVLSEGLTWYYQSPLHLEEAPPKGGGVNSTHVWDEKGVTLTHRPENVVGSYAVYYSKSNNQYQTGKFCHVFRPRVYDSKGGETWGQLYYNEFQNTLSVTVDRGWLDRAMYPVTIDPGFGFGSIGGSGQYYQDDWIVMTGPYSPVSDGTPDSITWYGKLLSGTSDYSLSIYENETWGLVGYTLEGSLSNSATWRTLSISSTDTVSSADQYLLCIWVESGTLFTLYYDYVGSWSSWIDMDTYDYNYPNPATPTVPPYKTGYHSSIYCNYTASGGGPVDYPRTATCGLSWSGNASRAFIGARVGDQVLVLNQDGTRSYTGSRSPSQGVAFSGNGSRLVDFMRGSSQTFTFLWTGSRSGAFSRTVTQAFTFVFSATGTFVGYFDFLIRVIDSLGAALEGALLVVWNSTDGVVATELTNNTGYVNLGRELIDNYTVQASMEGYETVVDDVELDEDTIHVIELDTVKIGSYFLALLFVGGTLCLPLLIVWRKRG